MRYISTAEFVQRIKGGRVKPVLPMIASKARDTWYKLPMSERVMLSESDLIQAGINFTVTHVAVKFDVKRQIKFSTFLFTALDNFYADVIRKVYADKRLIPRGLFSADSTMVEVNGRRLSLYDKIRLTRRTRGDSEDKIINRIDAERMFLKAYSSGSPTLRRYLIRWLLQPRVGRNKEGRDFSDAKKEFRKYAKSYLVSELCETIQNDYICRYSVASKIANDFSTLRRKMPLRSFRNKEEFQNTEEFAVAPILSREQILELIPSIG